MRKIIAFIPIWILFGVGHLLSIFMWKFDIGSLYKVYNWMMVKSYDMQMWARLQSPWRLK